MTPTDTTERIAALLHEAAETHHVVYRIVDGEDPDWASWYADWLVRSPSCRSCSARRPSAAPGPRLVELDRDSAGSERWEDAYGRRCSSARRRLSPAAREVSPGWGVLGGDRHPRREALA